MKKIVIYTGTRAEYGLLRNLIRRLKSEKSFDVRIVVSGSHLSPEFGFTYKEIENDGFLIDEKVEVLLSSDTSIGVAKAMGLGIISYAEVLHRLSPDLLIVLGDRYEAFAMASAATVLRIPIAHINGGDVTSGAIDEAMRHSMTKMSHLHFTTTEEYRKRVIQLGEQPQHVFNVGALGVENILTMELLERASLEKELDFKFKEKNILVTFHPVTLENLAAEVQMKELLKALSGFPDFGLIFTKANADAEGRVINRLIDEFVVSHPNSKAYDSLGSKKYLSALRQVDMVVGNSSSGIIEVPSFGIPTINIGDRQAGRLQTKTVINVTPEAAAIEKAIEQGLDESFKVMSKQIKNPYGHWEASKKITEILLEASLENLLKKGFHDINFEV